MDLCNFHHLAVVAIAGTAFFASDQSSWPSSDRSDEVAARLRTETIYRPTCAISSGDVQFTLSESHEMSQFRW